MACEGERSSRPTSLLLEGAAPEREPLRFDVQLVGAPPEVEQLVNNIKQVAEDFLYHWKTFPIVLPQSRFSGPGHHPSDIIIAPSCDELDAAALDAGLEPHPLSPKQLHSIREKGEFEVPSRHFPGQTHVWRVAGWLQRGRQRAHDDLCTSLARAAALIVVVARDRLVSEGPLSIRAAARAIMQAVHRILDLLFGMPYLEARDLDKRIREERSRYLVAELVCKPEQQDDVAALAAWVRRALRRAAEKDARDSRPPPAPHQYTTPQGVDIDLRLYRRETLRRLAPHLQAILESESRGWFLHFRERLGAELARQKVPSKDIEEEVRAAGMREYVRRVCSALGRSEHCAALRALLEGQLQCFAAYLRAEEGVKKELETKLAAAEARIRAAHPILSRADTWRNEKLEEAAARLRGQLKWRAMEDTIATLRSLRLEQNCYFLTRDLAFLRDREPLLAKELRAAKTPMREFVWATKIWFPRNWVVTRHFRGATERIPTTLVERPTSIITPRADPSQAVFSVRRDIFRRTDTRCPGWRLLNMQHRAWTWSWNMMFILGVAIPWNSPLSLRALLPPPFTPEVELSQVNGTLFPQRSSETQTMWSRLLMLWRRVSKERTRFETEPDTGLLGKGLSRLGNRVWNYGVIGGLGSVALLLLFPPAALLAVALSLLGALLAPLVMPALAVAAHVFSALLFEIDCVALVDRWFPLARSVAWRLGVLGALQLLGALGCALLLCPLAAALLVIGSVSWWSIRGLWERLTWRALLAGCARVPAHDSAFCRRVRGPHTPGKPAALELTAAQAVAGMCARAECEVLAGWAHSVETAIERPLRDYRHFVDACFGPFSVQIAKTGSYKQLEKECAELVASLKEKVSARRRELALGLSDGARARVRMGRDELRRAIQVGSVELSRVWAHAAHGDEWWGARALHKHDWPALAAHTLAEVFDADILVPLEEGAARLRLEGGEGAAARRWRALCRPEPPDVLDQLEWWSWGTGLAGRVAAPSLDAGAFSPRARALPPVPPPSAAALVLYNRDADNPLPLDSELCAEILRTLEDAPDCDDRRGDTDRYRTLDSSAGSASPDTEPHDIDREHDNDSTAACRISPTGNRAACRWTLTGRGVRLRADLASPEDVTLDAERGTSV